MVGLAWLLAGGCHALQFGKVNLDKNDKSVQVAAAPVPPGKFQFKVAPYVFLSDFEVKRDLPIFQQLAGLRDQVYKDLQLPASDRTVNVYLFEDRDRYDRFMQGRYPDLPKRRAFFVAQPHVNGSEDLLVYTSWGERIPEDLRHELTHALLHSVLKDVPLWLDEGIAEYYEVPPSAKGINYRHLERIERAGGPGLVPDLPRLEQMHEVQQMSPTEYREAWVWVHLFLSDKAEARAILINYLQELRVNPAPGPLAPRLARVYPSLNEAFARHLSDLQSSLPSAGGS